MTLLHENVFVLPDLRRSGFTNEARDEERDRSSNAEVHLQRLQQVPAEVGLPLVVDLDGTLVRSDLLIETFFAELGQRPHSIFGIMGAMAQGKAALKHRLAQPGHVHPDTLPYDTEVLAYVRAARDEGRKVFLASASHENLVRDVADHLGLFDGWFATNLDGNCAAEAKAQKVVAAFGEGGFDYIGNDAADLPVWRMAANAIAIRTSPAVTRKLEAMKPDAVRLSHDRPTWRSWAKLLRVHQYAKNLLIFVPLLTVQTLDPASFLQAFLAAIAFCLCASSVYIVNDLVDLRDDRAHHSKSNRPLASGAIPLGRAIIAALLLLVGAVAIAAGISLPFLGVLAGYYALTTAYSFFLKRKMLVDVITLAGLYTIRVVAGAVAINTGLSVWLIAFFMTWFLSLALIKRCTELVARRNAKLPDSSSRDYQQADIEMIAALAAASGFNAIIIFVLYASSDAAEAYYERPELLWLAAPILTYWIARALMLANRGRMHDDPIVFALKDRVSLFSVAAAASVVLVAM